MARGGFDFSQLEELQKRIGNMESFSDELCRECADELAARFYRKVVNKTRVGQAPDYIDKETYEKHWSNYRGGTLRRNWNVAFNESQTVKKGDTFERTLTNNTKYASYYEFGHRQQPGRFVPALGKRLKSAFVEGTLAMTKSEKEIQAIAPRLCQKKLDQKIEELMNGGK
jgi:hypothetical protein